MKSRPVCSSYEVSLICVTLASDLLPLAQNILRMGIEELQVEKMRWNVASLLYMYAVYYFSHMDGDEHSLKQKCRIFKEIIFLYIRNYILTIWLRVLFRIKM